MNLLAPRTCGACGVWTTDPEAALCAACECTFAPAPVPPDRLTAPRYASGAHAGGLRDAVLAFKTQPRPDLAGPLARRVVASIPPDVRIAIRTVVAIPDHPRRTAARGFDPAARLAVHVARAIDADLNLSALRWRVLRDKQAQLDAAGRAMAVDAIVAVTRPAGPVLVIDDVSTTGATLQGAVIALRAIGVSAVTTACVSATVRVVEAKTES